MENINKPTLNIKSTINRGVARPRCAIQLTECLGEAKADKAARGRRVSIQLLSTLAFASLPSPSFLLYDCRILLYTHGDGAMVENGHSSWKGNAQDR